MVSPAPLTISKTGPRSRLREGGAAADENRVPGSGTGAAGEGKQGGQSYKAYEATVWTTHVVSLMGTCCTFQPHGAADAQEQASNAARCHGQMAAISKPPGYSARLKIDSPPLNIVVYLCPNFTCGHIARCSRTQPGRAFAAEGRQPLSGPDHHHPAQPLQAHATAPVEHPAARCHRGKAAAGRRGHDRAPAAADARASSRQGCRQI